MKYEFLLFHSFIFPIHASYLFLFTLLSLKAASIIHTKYFLRYNGFSAKMHHTKELYYSVIYISLICHPSNISTGKRIHAFIRDNIDLTLLWNQSPIHVSENKVSCRITKMRSPMHWHVEGSILLWVKMSKSPLILEILSDFLFFIQLDNKI